MLWVPPDAYKRSTTAIAVLTDLRQIAGGVFSGGTSRGSRHSQNWRPRSQTMYLGVVFALAMVRPKKARTASKVGWLLNAVSP